MEIIFEILLQIILEIFGAILEHGWDKFKYLRTTTVKTRVTPKPTPLRLTRFSLALIYMFSGLAIGGLTLLVFPKSFITREGLRVISLALSPLVSGLFMHLIGKNRIKYGKQTVSFENFYYGFLFALGISLVRYIWAV